MHYIEKWRETLIEPVTTNFPCGVKVLEILSYPHAGNDVFVCNVSYKADEFLSVLKVERHCDANLRHECRCINELSSSTITVPDIISSGEINNLFYMFTKYVEGDRLSTILSRIESESRQETSIEYMIKFGENISRIHNIESINEFAIERKFQKIMSDEEINSNGLDLVGKWLFENKPFKKSLCFIHADHHYANILWKDNNVVCTLDWELCGVGWREFDMAWSIILRPSQNFLKSQAEIDAFLQGYSRFNLFNQKQFEYCMVLGYQYFFEIAQKSNDKEYEQFIRDEINRITELKLL